MGDPGLAVVETRGLWADDPPAPFAKVDGSVRAYPGNFPASQESTLNFPGPEQISQIKKSTYKTSGR